MAGDELAHNVPTPVTVGARHTCPRRAEGPGLGSGGPDPDRWDRGGHGLIGQERVGLSCSYCGSLHPGMFLDLVAAGWYVEPTDKSYKVYLAKPLTEQEQAHRRARWESSAVGAAVRKVAQDAGVDVQQALDAEWASMPHDPCTTVAKAYLQHLDAEQRARFIALHNDGTMRLGYPGRFYVPPFFIRFAAPDAPVAGG